MANKSDKDAKAPAKAKKTSPTQFVQQVRTETAKVTWPTRQETMTTTLMVFVMVVVVSLFFLAVDQVLRLGITALLGLDLF